MSMPGIIPSFEYDIFISYRHNDNRPSAGSGGWVTELVKALQEELASTIKDPVSVYFDTNPHDGLLETHNVDKSLEGKLKCLIFIPIHSQTYCDPKSFAWQHEFCAFNKAAKEDSIGRDVKLSNGNVASRILPIKIHDLDAEDKAIIENEIGGVLRAIEFIYKEPGVNRPLLSSDSLEKNLNKTIYRNQVNKVANAIKETISALKKPVPQKPSTATTTNNYQATTKAIGAKNKYILAALIFFTIVAAVYFLHPKFTSSPKQEVAIDRSIAVLPFQNMSSDKEQEYFSDGISEEIINLLTKVKGLKVAGRTSSFYYKGKNENLQKIGSELGVLYLLEGSIRKDGDNIRVTAQLIKSDDGFHVWSETYDRKLKGIFAIQDEISASIVEEMKLKLGKQNAGFTNNIEAYNLYLLAKHYRNNITDGYQAAFGRSMPYLKQAIEVSPDFVDAYALLAEEYGIAGYFNLKLDVEDNWEQAKSFATKALQLDSSNTNAWGALAYTQRNDRDYELSLRSLEKALSIDSAGFSLQQYGLLLCAVNKPSKGDKFMQRARHSC